jgi:hypothetical protein
MIVIELMYSVCSLNNNVLSSNASIIAPVKSQFMEYYDTQWNTFIAMYTVKAMFKLGNYKTTIIAKII